MHGTPGHGSMPYGSDNALVTAAEVVRRLVTGGAGFLGSHLCERLLDEDYEVLCLDNFVTGEPENVAHLMERGPFRLIRSDVTEFVHVGGPVDVVLHFASPASPIDYLQLPIETLEDLQNRRINAPGTAANWLQQTGATPVDGALTTYYTNVQTGVTEGALSFASGIYPIRLHEVAPHLTRVGIGSMVMGAVAINKQFHDSLPEEVQQAIREAGRATSRAHGEYVTAQSDAALKAMEEEGLQISVLSDEERARWVESLPNLVEPWIEQGGEAAVTVLNAYFDELRARGVEPVRDWTEGL
jgi:hypothetical protein